MKRRDLLLIALLAAAGPAAAQSRSYAARAAQRNGGTFRANTIRTAQAASPAPRAQAAPRVSQPPPVTSIAPSRSLGLRRFSRFSRAAGIEPQDEPAPAPEAPAPQFGALLLTAGRATRYGEPSPVGIHAVESGGGFIQLDRGRSQLATGTIGAHQGRPDGQAGTSGAASGRTAITTIE